MPINNVVIKSDLNVKNIQLKMSYCYADLPDKPKINNITLEGNKTSEELGLSPDKSFIYSQLVSASVWNITHNLDKYPSVSVVDSAGTEVYGSVTYIDTNTLKIEFNNDFAGKAYLN